MKKNDDDKKENKRGNWKKKLLLYLSCASVFVAPTIFFLTFASLSPSVIPPVQCFNDTTNCTNYPAEKACIPNTTIFTLNGGTFCKTLCLDNRRSFKCGCPAKKVWDVEPLSCSLECVNETGDCASYTNQTHCVSLADTSNGTDCKTTCENNVRNFECDCHDEFHIWDFNKDKCATACFNDSKTCDNYLSGNACNVNLAMYNLKGGVNCKTLCQNSMRTFTCDCPATKTWDSDLLTCSLECKKEAGDCVAYPNATHCVSIASTNNGTKCISLCGSNSRNYICDCNDELHVWDSDTNKCVLACLNDTKNCDKYSTGNACNVNLKVYSLAGGNNCKTLCKNDMRTFTCDCPTSKTWDSKLMTCSLECKKEAGNCASYPTATYCVSNTNNDTTCKTICDTSRNFICDCKDEYHLWNPDTNQCFLKCPDTDSATFPPAFKEGESCSVYPSKPHYVGCKTITYKGKYSYNCDCDTNYIWSYQKDPLGCQIKCQFSGACQDYYTAGGDPYPCIGNKDDYPEKNFEEFQFKCDTACVANVMSSMNCVDCFKFDPHQYINSQQKCIPECRGSKEDAPADFDLKNDCIPNPPLPNTVICKDLSGDVYAYTCKCSANYIWISSINEYPNGCFPTCKFSGACVPYYTGKCFGLPADYPDQLFDKTTFKCTAKCDAGVMKAADCADCKAPFIYSTMSQKCLYDCSDLYSQPCSKTTDKFCSVSAPQDCTVTCTAGSLDTSCPF